MVRFKLTSPGVLLILAVLAACGIFLLDAFFLRPHIDSQRDSALQEEAVKTRSGAEAAIQQEQGELRRWVATIGSNGDLAQLLLDPNAGENDDLSAFIQQVMKRTETRLAWLADPTGRVSKWWALSPPDTTTKDAGANTRAQDAAPIPRPRTTTIARTGPAEGFIRFAEGHDLAIFAQYPVPGPIGETPAGYLILARPLDAERMARISRHVGGKLALVAGSKMPAGVLDNNQMELPAWMTSPEEMAVAWPARDVAGEPVGYFLATVPVTYIQRQADASRRMVLIILSLSVGLALLVILGSHMLVTGPVVRLLQRLQRLDAGEGSVHSLAKNLHGEPLMLARRLENAFEKLAHISKTDQLTGLANRRQFEEVLECFYHQARRYNRPMSLMVMDVDFFKAVNDSGGHQAGDEVLQQVAGAIEEACRKADLPSRLGGDEFAVLLPETAADDAQAVGERIRQTVDSREIQVEGAEFHVTVSIGIADLNSGEMDSPAAMLGLADRALYAAKEGGRNRVVQAHTIHEAYGDDRQPTEDTKVNLLSKKLAGLDNQFKDLFLLAFDKVMMILEQRDPHMADHTRKVQHYATLIAQEMELPQRVIKRIEVAAMMHDLGMVALPDSILLCPGTLSEDQRKIMRRHPLLSVRIMERMEFLEQEIPAVRYHHERFDGKGYPEGIRGAAIPLTARILSVADAFDAMTSPRTYRTAKTLAEAIGEMSRGRGNQFDPTVVSAFLSVADRLGEELLHVPGVSTGRTVTPGPAQGLRPEWRQLAGIDAEEEIEAKQQDA